MRDFDRKQLVLYQLKWTAIYLAVAFIIMLFLPFPADLCFSIDCILDNWLVQEISVLKKIRQEKSYKHSYWF